MPLNIRQLWAPSKGVFVTLRQLRWATTSSQITSEGGVPAVQLDQQLRLSAIKLYKELHRLGRDYPDPNYEFNKRLRRIFEKNSKLTDAEEVKKQLEMGEHVKKEILAMLSLKKFRHLRRAYHPNEGPR